MIRAEWAIRRLQEAQADVSALIGRAEGSADVDRYVRVLQCCQDVIDMLRPEPEYVTKANDDLFGRREQ